MPPETRREERGFTMIEVMIAIVILSVGILTVVAAFATAVASTQNAQQNLIARQKALETLESIFTARNTQQITFPQIANMRSGGIFASGATPLWSAGQRRPGQYGGRSSFSRARSMPGRPGVHHAARSGRNPGHPRRCCDEPGKLHAPDPNQSSAAG